MTDAAKHIVAAVAAILIAGTSMTAIVTVPPMDNGPTVAAMAAPELA